MFLCKKNTLKLSLYMNKFLKAILHTGLFGFTKIKCNCMSPTVDGGSVLPVRLHTVLASSEDFLFTED